MKLYYATAATGKKYIQDLPQYAIRSLLKTGIDPKDVYCAVNNKEEKEILLDCVKQKINVIVVNLKYDECKWRYGGKTQSRKTHYWKALAMHAAFPKPIKDRCMVYFDGDVLWYSNPTKFLESKSSKTWFHHGKDLQKRASIKRSKVSVKNFDSLKKWCSKPLAYLLYKHKSKKIPEREVVNGFFILRPEDHKLLELTVKYCKQMSSKFVKHEGAGDQKSMNAALNVLRIDWHGGSRFFCIEHEKIFKHFMGSKSLKRQLRDDAKLMGL